MGYNRLGQHWAQKRSQESYVAVTPHIKRAKINQIK